MPRHIDHDRGIRGQTVRPICVLGMLTASGDQNQRGGKLAMSKWNLNPRGRAQGSSNSGYNFNLNTSLAERFKFFATSPEDEGVATLQPDHLQSQLCVVHEQTVDIFLRHALHRAALANIDQ